LSETTLFKNSLEFAIVEQLFLPQCLYTSMNQNSKQLKRNLLLSTYIYRSLPYDYLTTIAKNDKEKEHIRTTIKNLVTYGYLLKKQAKPIPYKHILLTLKGHTFVTNSYFNTKKKQFYQYKEGRLLLKPPYQHSFLNFAFIWHYLKKLNRILFQDTQIFEDSDINKCKITFSYRGNSSLISPDVIIYTPDLVNKYYKRAIFVENDTGRETYKTIYQKVVEYLALAEEGMEKNKLSTISLYFVFLSERRLKQLFLSKNGLIRFFDLYNKTNRGLEVRMRYLLKTLASNSISIYISSFNNEKPGNPYSFRQFNLAKILLEKEISWKNFL